MQSDDLVIGDGVLLAVPATLTLVVLALVGDWAGAVAALVAFASSAAVLETGDLERDPGGRG